MRVRLLDRGNFVSVRETNMKSRGATIPAPPRVPGERNIVLFTNREIRDRLITSLTNQGILGLQPTAGAHGIMVPAPERSDVFTVFPGVPLHQQDLIAEALLESSVPESQPHTSLALLERDLERQEESLGGDTLDAETGRQKLLCVNYLQDCSPLYRTLPGPEAVPCRMGPHFGGVLVFFRYCQPGGLQRVD